MGRFEGDIVLNCVQDDSSRQDHVVPLHDMVLAAPTD